MQFGLRVFASGLGFKLGVVGRASGFQFQSLACGLCIRVRVWR